MKRIQRSNRFKKDYRRMLRRGVDEKRFLAVIQKLAADEPLPEKCRPHILSGGWAGFWECHIAPDWLLIYEFDEESVTLQRTGTHSDLFE